MRNIQRQTSTDHWRNRRCCTIRRGGSRGVEASPINPSDLGLLLGMADVGNAQTVGEHHVEADVPEIRRTEGTV